MWRQLHNVAMNYERLWQIKFFVKVFLCCRYLIFFFSTRSNNFISNGFRVSVFGTTHYANGSRIIPLGKIYDFCRNNSCSFHNISFPFLSLKAILNRQDRYVPLSSL